MLIKQRFKNRNKKKGLFQHLGHKHTHTYLIEKMKKASQPNPSPASIQTCSCGYGRCLDYSLPTVILSWIRKHTLPLYKVCQRMLFREKRGPRKVKPEEGGPCAAPWSVGPAGSSILFFKCSGNICFAATH